MSTTTQSQDSAPDPGWPVTAIPQRWVEALFATMSATYGARFADLWRGTDLAQVKRHWGVELSKLTGAQMKAGRENLMQLVKAPTCPEFIAHCRQARIEAVASEAPKIEHTPSFTPEKAAEGMRSMRSATAKLLRQEPTAEWAYRLLMSGRKDLSFEAVKCASDAISSSAGRKVIEDCIDADLKAEYSTIRQTVVDNYRMRGQKLWETA